MQEAGGEIILPPAGHFVLDWASPIAGPAWYVWAGPGPDWRRILGWAEIGPNNCQGRGRPNLFFSFGLSPAQWFGPAQPDLILYYIYIYILYFVLFIYIYIYMKNYKNSAKIIKKYMCFCCNFITVFWLILVGILYCKDTKSSIKIPGFHQNIKDFQNKKCLLLSKIF